MLETYPIPIPEKLPVRINPCPIVEAIFEIRFTSSGPKEATIPGLLYAQIRDKYPEEKRLPIADVPEEIRRKEPAMTHLPVTHYISPDFVIQIGPRAVSLATKANAYPGWTAIERELRWMLERVQAAGFVSEGERLGVRYIDFFAEDIFQNLILNLKVGERPVGGVETAVTTILRRGEMSLRLQLSNSAIVERPKGQEKGSILDVDASFGALDFEVFENSLTRFGEAHRAIKELFFGLLRPEYFATLNPEYESNEHTRSITGNG